MQQVKEFKTHIGKIRASQSEQKDDVCAVLGLTHGQYCWHQYRQYERFVARVCAGHPQHRDTIRHSPIFRGFWNNEWTDRNIEFLEFAYECKFDEAYMMDEYKFIHNADRLYNDEEFYSRFESILKLIS